MGDTVPIFQQFGCFPNLLMFLKTALRDRLSGSASCFKKQAGMLSGPRVFETSRFAKMALILFDLTSKFIRVGSGKSSATVSLVFSKNTDRKYLFSRSTFCWVESAVSSSYSRIRYTGVKHYSSDLRPTLWRPLPIQHIPCASSIHTRYSCTQLLLFCFDFYMFCISLRSCETFCPTILQPINSARDTKAQVLKPVRSSTRWVFKLYQMINWEPRVICS